ncbi:MAG: hypothetical protein PHQ43_07970 [Dehalococcoidales bacterium]|nr:hypothetical protein [Dehalococcoidales bacterium]
MKRLAIPAAVFMLFIAGYVTLWFIAGKISVPVVQTINWIMLASAIILTVLFVGRDTRKRCYSWLETMVWIVVSITTFPIGFGLYYLLRGKTSIKQEAGAK